jgi:hypothetical protein
MGGRRRTSPVSVDRPATPRHTPDGDRSGSHCIGSFTWKPTVKGTYYVRAWSGGGTKYYADGSATAPTSGFDYQIPHLGNYSTVFRIVVR